MSIFDEFKRNESRWREMQTILGGPLGVLEDFQRNQTRWKEMQSVLGGSAALLENFNRQKNRWQEMQDSLGGAPAIMRALRENEARWRRTQFDIDGTARTFREFQERQTRWATLFEPSAVDRALQAATLAQQFALPRALEPYRTSVDHFAFRLATAQGQTWWRDDIHINAFARATAMSEALRSGFGVGMDLDIARRAFSISPIPELASLSQYRSFLGAAGLLLPRWPRFRIRSRAEKAHHLKKQLGAYAEPKHIRKAKSLILRYELILRDVIDSVMTEAFGDQWWESRLPLCGCRSLLGKWRSKGGRVLDHADFAHYELIMSHPEHFESGFSVGFDDREALAALLKAAGDLRAASHHPSENSARFTPQHLRDLHVTWRTIERGLIDLQPDFELSDDRF